MNDFSRGNELLRSRKPEKAIAAYQSAIVRDPYFHWYYYKLGEALEQLEQLEDAIAAYRKAIELKSNCILFHYKLGMALVESGHLDSGIEVFKGGLKLNPSDSKYYQSLANALAEKKEWQQAINQYNKGIKINPNSSQLQSDLASALKAAETDRYSKSANPHTSINLAFYKPTSQSSIFNPSRYCYHFFGACNGRKTGKFGFHTQEENQPWWQIDLQETYQLSEIKIYNRINFEERASTLNILSSQDALNWELCYSNNKENLFGGIDGKPLIVDLQHQVARFVRLQLRENEYFHLDEVEIYGIPFMPNGSTSICNQDEATLSANFYSHSPDDLLEVRFALQNGINLSLMKGQNFDPSFKSIQRIDPYKLLRFVGIDQLHRDDIISEITAIKITKALRFGNSVRQLSRAYNIAKDIGVLRIYLPNFWYMREGKYDTPSGLQIINTNQADLSSERIVLEGIFFYGKTLAPLSKTKPNPYFTMVDLIDTLHLKHSAKPLGENDLVIHIRSGDIFKNPHLAYGQPPLSFYQKIVELKTWYSISLVFEDKSNPIIDPLINFAKQHCPEVHEISGNLRSDIEYLLQAQVLVVSRGTFAGGIAAISKNIKVVYHFETNFDTFGNPNISCLRLIDKKGFYKSEILSNNWKNTESQRQLMLDYPSHALDFDTAIINQIKPMETNKDRTNINMNSNPNPNLNLALNKPTAQSSVFDAQKHNPYGACNGRKTGKFGFHTQKENQPWWQIDLQGTYQLSEIKIYNRINFEERASTLNILLSQDALNWELCYSNNKENLFGGIDGKPLAVDLQHKVARFVRLQLRENEYFHLDEVEIYGIPFKPDGSELNSPQDEATLSANFYTGSQPTPHVMQNLIMNMLCKLRMYDTDLGKVRIGSMGDGGYVIPNDLSDLRGIVSIGIGREVSFDLHFAEKGVKVFQYDHTIQGPPVIHDNLVFNKLGWGSQDGNGFITLSKMLETNGLSDGDLILKFDVENAEWDALFDVPPDLLKRFRIITCELHQFHALENISVFQKVNRVINLLTTNHTVVHIHPNNCCGTALVAGITLPKLIEFSFLRNDRADFYPSHASIPSSLDYPNVKSKPEIVLTPFHMSVNTNPDINDETTPPKEIPAELRNDFTLGDQIPVMNRYCEDTLSSKIYLRMSAYNHAFEKLEKGIFKYYGKTLDYLLSALNNYSILNKTVLIFGLADINCDAISLWKGATDVYVIDYNLPVSEHPKVKVFSHEDYISKNIQADVAISISSFEHDGLGRYGDPINPNGDLEAMKLAKKLIKKDGLLFFSVPVGQDCIVWNAHRIYGKIRLPMMFEGWKVLDSFGFSESLMTDQDLGRYEQPVFVLKNL
ncbi:MAG: discoidin domain-containing protein [Limnoraphis robusta]